MGPESAHDSLLIEERDLPVRSQDERFPIHGDELFHRGTDQCGRIL